MSNKSHMSVFYGGYRERNPIKWMKRFFRQWKWAYQRATRGYADCDAWDVRGWFLGVMPGMLETFAKDAHSFPMVTDPKEPHWAENKPVVLKDDLSDDPTDETTRCYNAWQNTLMTMAAKFREADESTCTVKNPMEDAWSQMYEEFDAEYGLFGSKLEEQAIKEKKSSIRAHFPSEMKEEWKTITEKYLEEEKKLDAYRVRCLDEAMTDFHNWFWDLWD